MLSDFLSYFKSRRRKVSRFIKTASPSTKYYLDLVMLFSDLEEDIHSVKDELERRSSSTLRVCSQCGHNMASCYYDF